MKRIDAVIRPQNLSEVKTRLSAVGISGFTITEALGSGRERHMETYRSMPYRLELVPKLLLTILCPDNEVEDIVGAIVGGARTGRMGDGKIFLTTVEEVIRIRTGEINQAAC